MGEEPAWESPARRAPPALVAAGLAAALVVGALVAREPAPPLRAPAGVPDAAAQADTPGPLGRWDELPAPPLAPRTAPVTVPAGAEVLVWGGMGQGGALRDGAAFDPAARAWRALPPAPLPWSAASTRGAVWTGQELVVLVDATTPRTLVYDPAADRWREGADPPRLLRWQHACGRGRDVVVFGTERDLPGRQVLLYEPGADRWSYLDPPPVRAGGRAFACSRLGDALALVALAGPSLSVTVLDPGRSAWSPPARVAAGDVQDVRRAAAVQAPDSSGLVVTGEVAATGEHRAWSWSRQGGWRSLPPLPVPHGGPTPLLAWTGEHVLAWVPDAPGPGLALRPGEDARWRPLAAAPVPSGRRGTMLWTGEVLLVWDAGHRGGSGAHGAVFDPS